MDRSRLARASSLASSSSGDPPSVETLVMPDTQRTGYGETFFVPLNPSQFECLGKIVTTLGLIEGILDTLLLHLIGTDNYLVLEALTEVKQFGSKVETLRKLAKIQLSGDSLELC